MEDRYLFRGMRCELSKVPYGDGWVIGSLVEMPASFHKSGHAIVQGNRYVYDDVDSKTIGQCTGRKDRNGRLIFEGDILKYTREDISSVEVLGFVEYCGKKMGWYMNCDGSYKKLYGEGSVSYDDYELEVTGNIHQHPDILDEFYKFCQF